MSGNKHDGTYVRKKLFNSVEPSEIQPSFLIEALRNAVKQEKQCLRQSAPFSLPFSQQTAVAHQGVPKSLFVTRCAGTKVQAAKRAAVRVERTMLCCCMSSHSQGWMELLRRTTAGIPSLILASSCLISHQRELYDSYYRLVIRNKSLRNYGSSWVTLIPTCI